MKSLLTKSLLLCTLVAVISTGCGKKTEVMEQPAANEMAPTVQQKVIVEPTAVKPTVNPAEEKQATPVTPEAPVAPEKPVTPEAPATK